ncbi:MAG: hypothetical protein ACRDNZ_23440 [Streptosporangiaceae bacterium]
MSPDYLAGNSREYIARHESGHAVGYWSQGIPLAYVTIVGHGSQPRPHTQPVDPAQAGYGQKILAYASGVIAGFQYNRQRLSDAGIAELLVGSADDQFEIVGLVSGARTRLPRAPLVGPGEDLELISPEATEQPFTASHAVTFWRDCERFVVSVAPAIDAIAQRLAGSGHLGGSEVAALAVAGMTGRPTAWIPRWVAEQ